MILIVTAAFCIAVCMSNPLSLNDEEAAIQLQGEYSSTSESLYAMH